MTRRKAALPEQISQVGMGREAWYPLGNRNPRGLSPLDGHRARQTNDVRCRKRSTDGFRLGTRTSAPEFAPKGDAQTHHYRRHFPHWSFDTRTTNWGLRAVAWCRCPIVGRAFCVRTGASEHDGIECGGEVLVELGE